MFISPFLPHFLGAPKGEEDTAPKASGCILGGTRKILREEPGKQKPGSCRAQELSRSRAQEKERRKRKINRSARRRRLRNEKGRAFRLLGRGFDPGHYK